MAMFVDSKNVIYACCIARATANVHRDIYLLTSPREANSFAGRKLDTWNINACPMSSMDFAQTGNKVESAWETRRASLFRGFDGNRRRACQARPSGGQNHKHPRLAIAPNGETRDDVD